ncbi:rod shape-determining protein [Patescibacteria group bacterium]|nr:rod shape-determining protein [Patescibacteria group bacterium]
MILDFLFGLFSYDLGIDLGTANTMVFVKGKGVVIREPSVVARDKKTGKVLAIGKKAKDMVGKTPDLIEAIRPLRDGVIADFDATEAMLKYYVQLVHQVPAIIPRIPRPKVVIGIPSGVTEVERRAVADAALSAGARQAYLIEEPMAAAIGAGLPVLEPDGQLIVDIGGGTTDIAVISLGGIVIDRCLWIAGDELDEAITAYIRLRHGLLLGEVTAEQLKIKIGSAAAFPKPKRAVVRGRDMETGLPKSLNISSLEVREAIMPVIQRIVTYVVDTLEETPPELVADIMKHGVVLCGGGGQLYGLDKVIGEATKMNVWLVEKAQEAVVRGCGKVLSDEALLKQVMVK